MDQWFYGRGSDITGPVTGPELSGLAAGGTLLPTDTVWRDGVEDGVLDDLGGDLGTTFPSIGSDLMTTASGM